MPDFDLRVSSHRDDARVIVDVCGDVDLATSPAMRRGVLSLMSEGFSVTLDLSRVRFMDMSGLHVLVELLRTSRLSRTDFSVANPSGAVMRVAELTCTTTSLLSSHLRRSQPPDRP